MSFTIPLKLCKGVHPSNEFQVPQNLGHSVCISRF